MGGGGGGVHGKIGLLICYNSNRCVNIYLLAIKIYKFFFVVELTIVSFIVLSQQMIK